MTAFIISISQKQTASADVWKYIDGANVNCSTHYVRFRISSHYTNDTRINGVRVDFGPSNAKGYIVRDCPAVWFDSAPYWSGVTGYTGNNSNNFKKAVADGDGYVEFDANCMNTLPYIEFSTPSSMVFVQANATHNGDTYTAKSVGAFNGNFANGSKGWLYKSVWKTGINATPNVNIDLIFRDKNIWNLNGDSSLSNPVPTPSTSKNSTVNITTVSKNLTFKHVISNASVCGGVPCNTASFKYKIQKCVDNLSLANNNFNCSNYVDVAGSQAAVSSLTKGSSISPVTDSSITIPTTTANGALYCERIYYWDADGPDANGDGNAKASTPACYKAIKTGAPTISTTYQSPYFQLRNGSIMAGCNNGFLAGFYNNSGPGLGSSTTLASISNGDIVGFASMLNTSRPYAGSFANTDQTKNTTDINSPLLGGNFGLSNCYLSPSFSLPTAPYSDNTAFNGSSNSYTKNTTIAATAQQTISQSKKVVININGDAYIKNNIRYSSWTAIDQMPSLVIKASGNIYIDPSVTQLDGTFISDNSIYTCSTGFAVGGGLSASSIHSTCKNQLVVYGAFIAKKINLLRTFGDINNTDAGPCSNPLSGVKIVSNSCAAEVFILSPEIYLNGTNLNSVGNNRSVLPYDMIKSLPPTL